jgi:hypothetical protein
MTARRILFLSLALASPLTAACSGTPADTIDEHTTGETTGSQSTTSSSSTSSTRGSTTSSGVSCDAHGGQAQLDSTTDPTEKAIEQQAASFLDGYVGQFVRGEAVLYTGTMDATTGNDVAPGSPAGSATMKGGGMFGALTLSTGSSQLMVLDPAQQNYLIFSQSSGSPQTSVSPIFGYLTTGGNLVTCASCFPSLSKRPASIDVTSLSATAQTEWEGEVYANVAANLTAVAPCSITYADIAAVNGKSDVVSGASFQAEGPDMVWHMSGVYNDAPNLQCGNATPYTLDLYVTTATPWDFGVRNYTAGATTRVCHQDPP